MSTTPDEPRFEQIQSIMSKAMTHARSQLDLKVIIRECYGNDLTMFGGHDGLQELVGNMLDGVQDEVLQGMKESLQKQKVDEMLNKLDRLIQEMDQRDETRHQQEVQAKDATEQAIRNAVLPSQFSSPDEMVRCLAFDKLKSEKQSVLAEIARVEAETARYHQQRDELAARVDRGVENWQQMARKMEKSADMCSMVS